MTLHLGYTKPLFILPFDHRTSFMKGMFGIDNRPSSLKEIDQIKDIKHVIYEAFKRALTDSIPKDHAAILVDEQFGDAIIRDATTSGYHVILTIEKSGKNEFDFEYGEAFPEHIEKYKPTFVKALVRYNPEGDQEVNKRQRERLKILNDYAHQREYKLLIESLVPPTESQLMKVSSDQKRYDAEVRPALEIQTIQEFQNHGIEPDVWKIEGMEQKDNYEKLVNQVRAGGRDQVGIVVLGRGADASQVEKWVSTGAQVDGIIGFAVGRTVFWDPLSGYRDDKMGRDEAVEQIAKNYLHFYRVFTDAKKEYTRLTRVYNSR